ncbi:MAG: hypothetical protein ACQCN6_12350 [Candidatus Bathyarchaeia archaeon]
MKKTEFKKLRQSQQTAKLSAIIKRTPKKTATIATTTLLVILTSIILSPFATSQVFAPGQTLPPGSQIPTYAFINVAPNPVGVGQTVNVNYFLSSSLLSGESVINCTVKITDPDGNVETKGPLTGDSTGGGFFNFVPDQIGNYTFQFFYGGQVTGISAFNNNYDKLVELPSESKPYTLVVQNEPITQSAYPITPLPTTYWEAPVTAQNVQEWYKIMGPWLGISSPSHNSVIANPYTESVLSGHVLWTKSWGAGGVVGGDAGGTEDSGNYWTTRQYWPQYKPVIINGIMYANHYPETTSYSDGIIATNLYTGETLFTINTTTTMIGGMIPEYRNPNMYGHVGPYIITTGSLPASDTGGKTIVNVGTQFNLYSGTTGQYVCSIVNGSSSFQLRTSENGHLLAYYLNRTAGTMNTYTHAAFSGFPGFAVPTVKEQVNITSGNQVLCCFNFSQALSVGNTWGWTPEKNGVYDFSKGVMWAEPVPAKIDGQDIFPALDFDGFGDSTIVLSSYFFPGMYWQSGWKILASMDATTGDLIMCKNFTYPDYQSLMPFTRYKNGIVNDVYVQFNYVNWKVDGIDLLTGSKLWTTTLKTPYGDGTPDVYSTIAAGAFFYGNENGKAIIAPFGGDIFCIDGKTGTQLWYTNTTTLIGSSGIESPYGIWPIWTAGSGGGAGFTTDVGYFGIGHEYTPPMFHGAQLIAINLTDGTLLWSELGSYIRSNAIAYGTLLSLNVYDNLIYAFGKGPTSVTVTAPSIGITTATPITITGTVTDVSAGTMQSEVAKNYPNGLPCVSDESQSRFMEHVYQNQPMPSDVTGVPITLAVVDSNGNYREIGQTTSNPSCTFSYTWTPDIAGDYILYASFAGSNSYYPASAQTAFYASDIATPTPTQQIQSGFATFTDILTIVVAGVIAIIIAIAIVGVLLLRKRP